VNLKKLIKINCDMSEIRKQSVFKNRYLPYVLIAPQIIITLIFFMWPSVQAVYQSFMVTDAFGLKSEFVWFDNFVRVLSDELYHESLKITLIFSTSVTVLAMGVSLLLALFADHVLRAKKIYQLLLTWPYALAPPVAAALWIMMFQPGLGVISIALENIGIEWNYYIDATKALILVIVISAWTQVGYNFVFFLAGLQMIPKSLIEAAAIDGAGPVRRLWSVVLPLLTPTIFFLLVMNIVSAFFGTFGIIDVVTSGGPGNSTNILIYKLYVDGFKGLDLSGSAVQSVILMLIVGGLTFIQFKYLERKVHY